MSNITSSDHMHQSVGETSSAHQTESPISPSLSSDIDLEKLKTSPDDTIHDHIDVQFAEQQFTDLKMRYSNISEVTSAISERSRRNQNPADTDEKGSRKDFDEVESEDEFDVEDVLRDRHRREVEHDFKPKHLGNCQSMLSNAKVLYSRI